MNEFLSSSQSLRKLLGGILRVVVVVLFWKNLGPKWLSDIKESLVAPYLDDPKSTAYTGLSLLGSLFALLIAVLCLYFFVIGLYKIYTFRMYIPFYESKLDEWQKRTARSVNFDSHIDSAYSYRDSKMRYMNNEEAARFYLDTNKIMNSPRNSSTTQYINSKLKALSPEGQINFLRGKK